MFGIKISSMNNSYVTDLTNGPKIFDVKMKIKKTINGNMSE